MNVTETLTTSETAGTKPTALRLITNWPILAVGFTGALMLLWRLGSASLDDWDEAIYAQISKEAVASGNWWTLHWGYVPFFEKPPVFMWATAILFKLFGVSEFWARAASAFSGIALLIVVFLIARQLYDRRVGFLAVAILLSSYQFIASSRFGTTDILLGLFSYAAIYAYLRLKVGDERWWIVIWAMCGLAVMTKSAAGVMAPCVIILTLLIDRRVKAALRSRPFWFGLFIAGLIIVPWHLIMYLQYGPAFINQYIGHSIVERSVSVLDQHTGDRFFYIDRLQKYFFPWVYVAPFAVALTVREMLRGQRRALILMLMTVVVFGICTAMQTKLRWYIVPLYPALAILIASMLLAALRSYASLAFSGLVMAVLVAGLLVPLKIVGLFSVPGLAIILFSLMTGKRVYRPLTYLMCAFLIATGLNTLKPLYAGGETPVAKLARLAGERDSNRRTPLIVASGLFKPAPLFYSNRPVKVVYRAEDLTSYVHEQRLNEIILAEKDIEPLSADYNIQVLEKSEPLVYATIIPASKP
jgi:4-amino-4-deoxy-L-arabinose transferase-like glycosyltransferase